MGVVGKLMLFRNVSDGYQQVSAANCDAKICKMGFLFETSLELMFVWVCR